MLPGHLVLFLSSTLQQSRQKEQRRVLSRATTSLLAPHFKKSSPLAYVPPEKRLEDSPPQKWTRPREDNKLLNNWESFKEIAQQNHPTVDKPQPCPPKHLMSFLLTQTLEEIIPGQPSFFTSFVSWKSIVQWSHLQAAASTSALATSPCTLMFRR